MSVRAQGPTRPHGRSSLRTYLLALAVVVPFVLSTSGTAAAHGLIDPLPHLDDGKLGSLGLLDEEQVPKLVLPFALPEPDAGAEGSLQAAQTWLRSAYGLTPAQADQRLADESRYAEVAQLLQGILGDEAAGFWVDRATGDLIAGVDSDGAAQIAELAGAKPRRMRHSAADLAAAKRLLDQRAQSGDLDGARAWYIDQPGNQIVVEVVEEVLDKVRGMLAALGDLEMVQIQPVPSVPHTQAGRLVGGQEIEIADDLVCSTAFNARDSRGRDVLLTAGHCTKGLDAVTYRGSEVGKVRRSVFPEDDFGLIQTNLDDWSPVGAVDGGDGHEHPVAGYTQLPVGATVCKSGRTSGWTCGSITAHDATVQYEHGELVYGLTKETACSLDGDSGGAVMAGNKAVGIVSGGQTMLGGCLSVLGMDNVSFYQPIREVLDRLELTLLTKR